MYEPEGAFYLWVDISKALGRFYKGRKIESSKEFCQVLLEDYFVATVPGEEFGNPGFMRLSFAIDSDRMSEAINRMQKLIASMTV